MERERNLGFGMDEWDGVWGKARWDASEGRQQRHPKTPNHVPRNPLIITTSGIVRVLTGTGHFSIKCLKETIDLELGGSGK